MFNTFILFPANAASSMFLSLLLITSSSIPEYSKAHLPICSKFFGNTNFFTFTVSNEKVPIILKLSLNFTSFILVKAKASWPISVKNPASLISNLSYLYETLYPWPSHSSSYVSICKPSYSVDTPFLVHVIFCGLTNETALILTTGTLLIIAGI